MADMPLSDVIKTSLENIKTIIDSNTVLGEPVTVLENTAIIPVSKISVGFASAGAEYAGKADAKSGNKFGGGGGTGITLVPVAFIVVNRDGEVKMLNVDTNLTGGEGYVGMVNALDSFVDKAPGMVEKIKTIFKKEDAEKTDAE